MMRDLADGLRRQKSERLYTLSLSQHQQTPQQQPTQQQHTQSPSSSLLQQDTPQQQQQSPSSSNSQLSLPTFPTTVRDRRSIGIPDGFFL